ncbi:MAG TPA: peptide deformylase [Gammaproteobacteria bacterium]|nr:peptide deformylase [Gammaproteobacteria bacterium]
MSVLEIIAYPDERLKRESDPVTVFDEKLSSYIADLEQTMRAGPGGVGIAAPQTGHFQRIVIVDVSGRKETPNHGPLVLINPEITAWEGMKTGREGCMSVPDFTGNVIRAERIHLKAQNQQGEWQEYDMQGFEARAVQHEVDHLNGILFLDRLVSRRHDLFKRKVYQDRDN